MPINAYAHIIRHVHNTAYHDDDAFLRILLKVQLLFNVAQKIVDFFVINLRQNFERETRLPTN